MSTYVKTVGVVVVVSVGAYLTAKIASSPPAITATPIEARPKPPAVGPKPTPSAVMTIEEDAWTGVLVGQSTELVARIETKVKTVAFKVGDHVKADDVVAELDTTQYEHEIAAGEATIRAAQAESWGAGVMVQQARDMERRRSGVVRYGNTEIPLVSVEEREKARFDGQAASARASAASATADERRARLAHLHDVVKNATLRAPFDGIISTLYAYPGMIVRSGASVVRIVGKGGLRVRFAVPEGEAGPVKLSSRVTIEWDDRRLEGTVERIAPEVESLSSSIVMEASVTAAPDDAEHKGLSGRVVGVRLARPRPRG